MTTTNDTPPGVDTPDDDEEVKNPAALLRRNKELMNELKAAQCELRTAQDAHQASQADMAKWRDRWYRVAVEEPLDADLRNAARVPMQYLKDLCIKHGLLRMEPDPDDGLLRPRWYTVKGEPDDAPYLGVGGHLSRALSALGRGQKGGYTEVWAEELAKATHQPRGGGAIGSPHGYHSPAPPKPADAPAPVQRPTFGLS